MEVLLQQLQKKFQRKWNERKREEKNLAISGQTKLKVNLATMYMLQALECTTNKLTYIRLYMRQAVR